jgi:hypothetical protein
MKKPAGSFWELSCQPDPPQLESVPNLLCPRTSEPAQALPPACHTVVAQSSGPQILISILRLGKEPTSKPVSSRRSQERGSETCVVGACLVNAAQLQGCCPPRLMGQVNRPSAPGLCTHICLRLECSQALHVSSHSHCTHSSVKPPGHPAPCRDLLFPLPPQPPARGTERCTDRGRRSALLRRAGCATGASPTLPQLPRPSGPRGAPTRPRPL